MVDPTQAVGGVGGGVGAAVGATVGTTAEAAPALVCRWCGETALVELIAPVIFCSVCGRVSDPRTAEKQVIAQRIPAEPRAG